MPESLGPLLFLCLGIGVAYYAAKRAAPPLTQRATVMSQARRDTFDANADAIDFSLWDDDAYGIYEYATQDGRYYFVFDLQPASDGEVRIYIDEQPDYEGRCEGSHETHRYGLSDDKPWVCVRGEDRPTNVPDALSWAQYWAEQTGHYIDTGEDFS